MTLRDACNIQCQGCREDWPILERTPSRPGGAELYHKPIDAQSHTLVNWPMDCEAWRIRKVIGDYGNPIEPIEGDRP